ncbi:MAG TPA: hypothetical protein DIU15_08845 [Deltaproteobacteria bacterium]|nr:hypothetical protein [Deltaproteobacteria bacterium]
MIGDVLRTVASLRPLRLMVTSITAGFLATGTLGCTPPPEAPEDLSELNRYMYREWDAEDPEVLEAGITNLDEFVQAMDFDGELGDRASAPTGLEEEDVIDVERPAGRSLLDTVNVALAYHSPWPITDHAALIIREDQAPAQPSAPEYTRYFLNVDDPTCFVTQDCDMLQTSADVIRQNPLMSVHMSFFKSFRWTEISETDTQEARRAIVARSWMADSFESETPGTVLWQSYAIDIWMENSDDTVHRYQVMWSETEIPGITDPDIIRGTLRLSMDDTFEAEDAVIADSRQR